jgi:hypothetical protein
VKGPAGDGKNGGIFCKATSARNLWNSSLSRLLDTGFRLVIEVFFEAERVG